jgi:hypothetical protein
MNATVLELTEEEFQEERTRGKKASGAPVAVEISAEEFEAEKKGVQQQQEKLAEIGVSPDEPQDTRTPLKRFEDNALESITGRVQQASDIYREEGEYSDGLAPSSKFLGGAGAMAGLGWDLFGDIYTLSADGYSLMIPDDIEEAAKQEMQDAVTAFVEHPLGKKAQQALEAGKDTWIDFKKENPEMALVVESVFNVSGWHRRGPNAKPVSVADDSLPNVSTFDQKSRTVSQMSVRERGIWKVIAPRKSYEETNQQTTEPRGIFRRQETIISDLERRIIETVKRYARVDPSRTDRANAKSITSAVADLDAKLLKLLKADRSEVSHGQAQQTMATKLTAWISENQGLGAKRLAEESKRAMAQVQQILSSHPQTALGMLQARRELDRWIKKNYGADTLKRQEGKKGAIARNEIFGIIRRTMNESMDTQQNKAASKILQDESDLLTALGTINARVPEGDTVFARLRDNLGAMNIQMPTTPLGQAATANAAMNSKMLPFFAGLITTYTGLGLAKRAYSKLHYQKELRIILESINDGIKVATNEDMVKALRADRAAIIEVYKGYMEDAEEEAKEEADE